MCLLWAMALSGGYNEAVNSTDVVLGCCRLDVGPTALAIGLAVVVCRRTTCMIRVVWRAGCAMRKLFCERWMLGGLPWKVVSKERIGSGGVVPCRMSVLDCDDP